MALITCSECGKMISDRAKACPHCGSPVRHSEDKKVHSTKTMTQDDAENSEKRVRKSKAGLIVAIVLVLLALLGASGWLWYDNHQKLVEQERKLVEQERKLAILREQALQDSIMEAQRLVLMNTVYNEYANVLKQHDYGDYFLFDITQDGTPEIWITAYNKLEREEQLEWPDLHIFTIADGKAKKLCDAESGGSYYQGKDYIIANWNWKGDDFRLIKMTYNGNRVIEKVIRNYSWEEENSLHISELKITTHDIGDLITLKNQIQTYFSN